MLPAFRQVPVLDCRASTSQIAFEAPSPAEGLRSPRLRIPHAIQSHLDTAAEHLRAERLVAFPTETVYGLGGATLSDRAVKQVYALKGRPSDNPLIVHVSSLDMLDRLLPPCEAYTHSQLYLALMEAFWPGPLTLLFPHPDPPPAPAPQTRAVRLPAHPLARAMIHHADTPVSAPSANSSGRPSPTTARHVEVDLGRKDARMIDQHGQEQPVLGCILDGGPCDVGVESTVVDGLDWSAEQGGTLKLLRPGGIGVEELERVVRACEKQVGLPEGSTRVVVHGKHRETLVANGISSRDSKRLAEEVDTNGVADGHASSMPSTPGMKYKHYSPSVPVFLLLPNNVFTSRPAQAATDAPAGLDQALDSISATLPRQKIKFGLMHYEDSPLAARVSQVVEGRPLRSLRALSMGKTADDAARALFAGLLSLEGARGAQSGKHDGVDVILVEGCTEKGLGLAIMERVRKAVGGGGQAGKGLDLTEGAKGAQTGCFWVDVYGGNA